MAATKHISNKNAGSSSNAATLTYLAYGKRGCNALRGASGALVNGTVHCVPGSRSESFQTLVTVEIETRRAKEENGGPASGFGRPMRETHHLLATMMYHSRSDMDELLLLCQPQGLPCRHTGGAPMYRVTCVTLVRSPDPRAMADFPSSLWRGDRQENEQGEPRTRIIRREARLDRFLPTTHHSCNPCSPARKQLCGGSQPIPRCWFISNNFHWKGSAIHIF